MGTLANFSFTNVQIKEFFEGSDKYKPVSELIYVHTHPLVRPNFLDEIEALIHRTDKTMVDRRMTGAPVKKLTDLAKRLGKEMPDITEDNAQRILNILRDIYKLCNTINRK